MEKPKSDKGKTYKIVICVLFPFVCILLYVSNESLNLTTNFQSMNVFFNTKMRRILQSNFTSFQT